VSKQNAWDTPLMKLFQKKGRSTRRSIQDYVDGRRPDDSIQYYGKDASKLSRRRRTI